MINPEPGGDYFSLHSSHSSNSYALAARTAPGNRTVGGYSTPSEVYDSEWEMKKFLGAWELVEDGMYMDYNDTVDQYMGGRQDMDLPRSLLVSFSVILVTLLIIGVIGNVLVIFVLVRSQWQDRHSLVATSSTTNAYILHLSSADLLFLVFCAPFQGTVYILNHWPFGWFMCKLAHYCQYCTVYASVWILTTMSVDRYVAIGHPLKSVKWRHPTQARRISLLMWLLASVVSVPWMILYETDEYETDDGNVRVACYDAWSDSTYHYRKWMILFGFLIGFLIPSVVIFCMALLIAKSIHLSTHQPLLTTGTWVKGGDNETSSANGTTAGGGRLRRRRRVGWLVFALSLVFFICWAPHNFSLLWLNFDSNALDWITEHYQAFFVVKLVAHIMTYLNGSFNPILYTIGSNHFFHRLALTCGLVKLGPQAASSNCRAFANRTLHADSILIQFPVSRSSSRLTFSRKTSSKSLPPANPPPPATLRKPNVAATASNPRRPPVIPSPGAHPPTATANRRKDGANLASAILRQNGLEMGAVPIITRRLQEARKMQAMNSRLDQQTTPS